MKGVGVNETAFETWPQEWTPVIAEEDLVDSTLVQSKANDVHVLLYKEGEEIYALPTSVPIVDVLFIWARSMI